MKKSTKFTQDQESSDDNPCDNPEKNSRKKSRHLHFRPVFISVLFLIIVAFLSLTCSKEKPQEIPTFKNISLKGDDFSKFIEIGKVINGIPELDQGMLDAILDGVYNEKYTYRRLWNSATYSFDINTLSAYYVSEYSGIYYLVVRGTAFVSGEEHNFIIAYELGVDSNGIIYNVSKTQHMCQGGPCQTGCPYKHNETGIVGCGACSDEGGSCNHTTFTIDHGGYLIIPIKVK